jgi:hypothetical protein
MWVSVRADDLVMKYRSDGKGEFFYEAFDMADDPNEEHDIFDRHDPVQRSLVDQLDRYRKALVEGYVDPRDETSKRSQSEEAKLVEQLRALGYIE